MTLSLETLRQQQQHESQP